MKNKLTNALAAITLITSIAACNNGSNNNPLQSSYPRSGKYLGLITGIDMGSGTTIEGTSEESDARFTINSGHGTRTLRGKWQYPGTVCFRGSESIDHNSGSFDFTATNCTIIESTSMPLYTIHADYTDARGDGGTLQLTLESGFN